MLDHRDAPRFYSWMNWLLVIGGGLLFGCSTVPNPLYCDENSDCKNGFVCNLDTNGCEAQNDAAIDSSSGSCALDDECQTGVCRSDGSCELAEKILYVAADGISAGECPADARCEISYALSKVSATVSTIRLANGLYDLASDLVIDRDKPDITIVGGRAAVLRRSTAGVVINVRGVVSGLGPTLILRGMTINKGLSCFWAGLRLQRAVFDSPPAEPLPWISSDNCAVSVLDSELRNSTAATISGQYTDLDMIRGTIAGSKGPGVSIANGVTTGRGIVRLYASTITNGMDVGIALVQHTSFTLERSTVSHNLLGGISSLGAPYDLSNNFIVRNGTEAFPIDFGGLRLTGSGRALHNTIAMNDSPPEAAYAGGIYCDGGIATNNIIASNFRGNAELPFAQTRGSCNFSGSMIDQTYSGPVFIDILTDNFHLASASPAVNAGGSPQVALDYDGDARADGAADLGADELQ